MKQILMLTGLLANVGYSAELPVLENESKILSIPLAAYKTNETTLYFRANLQASADFSSFALLSADFMDAPDESDNALDVNLTEIDGSYDGSLVAYEIDSQERIGPFSSCPSLPFNPGSTDIEVQTDSVNIEITIDVFPDLVCLMTGMVTEEEISGTFQCSDFNDGSWTSGLLTSYPGTNVLIAKASLIGDSCSFDFELSALKD